MNSRQFQLAVISLVLIGPLVTLITLIGDTGSFSLFLFPITIDSFNFWKDADISKELSYLRFIIPLFMMKVFVIGVISWIRLVRNRDGGTLLTRFYILAIAISLIKATAYMVQFEVHPDHFAVIAAFMIWILILGIALKRHRVAENLAAEKAVAQVERID
jgi:hypothetical protein